MKNKTLCSQMSLIHISDLEKNDSSEIELKPNKEFTKLLLEGKAEYSSQSQHTDAGVVLNENVKAKIKYSSDLSYINSALKYYVLKLHTDSNSFIVGSFDYPTELTYTEDKIHINLSFKSSKPI